MKSIHVVIIGHVQGVGFRKYIKKHAEKNGVTGWIKNTENGNVECLLQGKEKSLEEMLGQCRKGPFLSSVKDMKAIVVNGLDQLPVFEILPD